MKIRFPGFILSFLLGCCMLSCNKSDIVDNAFNYINLEFYEHFTTAGSELYFHISTVETFPCSNFTLDVTTSESGDQLFIKVFDIDVPDICITNMGPATQVIQIGPFSRVPEGFSLWVNDKKHDFQLPVNEHHITTSKGRTFENHLFFTFDTLMRIPEKTVWGFFVFEPEQKENTLWEKIIHQFVQEGTNEMTLSDGNYYYFTVKDHKISFENIKEQSYTFYFNYDQSLQNLADIYKKVMEENEGVKLQLRLFNTRGERLVL